MESKRDHPRDDWCGLRTVYINMVFSSMNFLYLTRRNLLTLLNKLDRAAGGDASECTIIKYDTDHPKYPITDVTAIQAIEDKDYYTDRPPGDIHHKDQPPYDG